MIAALGNPDQQCYFSFERSCTGGFYRVTPDELEKLAGIKGITKAREGDDIMRCWR